MRQIGKGSGVIFGEPAFHVVHRRPKMTPDPVALQNAITEEPMDWQLTISLIVVALAVADVLRRMAGCLWGRSSRACGACHRCPTAHDSDVRPHFVFVPLSERIDRP
ncbi:MAG: hypothetical protein EA424_15915 [Planctomycetaceae bacterium]|nr:MAG: hypothetical protein EA424_15915 [Planctomycetaceae bacterium]